MADNNLPPAPVRDPWGSYTWEDWFRKLRDRAMAGLTSVLWSAIDFTASSLTDILDRKHNDLQSIQGGTSAEYYHLTNDEYTGAAQSGIDAAKLLGNTWASPEAIGSTTPAAGTFTDLTVTGNTTLGDTTSDVTKVSGNLVLPKNSGYGLQVDTASPSFGWRDILGHMVLRSAGGGGAAAMPDYVVYRGNIYAYRFGTTVPDNHLHEAFVEFHIPHDYTSGTDLHLHVHWSQIVVDTGGAAGVPGVAKWYFDVSYAKGHGTPGGTADPFVAPITISVTQQGSTTQYGHMIAEVQCTNNGGTGGLLDSNNIEPDGVLLVRIYRDPTDVADTLNQNTFVHFVDVHYQSTNMATKNKSPNFYS